MTFYVSSSALITFSYNVNYKAVMKIIVKRIEEEKMSQKQETLPSILLFAICVISNPLIKWLLWKKSILDRVLAILFVII